jgi:hypothetical protein
MFCCVHEVSDSGVNRQGQQRSLDTLLRDLKAASRLRSLPNKTHASHEAIELEQLHESICVVLDIRSLNLTSDKRSTVSVVRAALPGSESCLIAAHVRDAVGLRAYGDTYGGLEQAISLVSSMVFGRGQRIWLECSCGTKAMKLYLPNGGDRFACADCHRLQTGHARGIRRDHEQLPEWNLEWRPVA